MSSEQDVYFAAYRERRSDEERLPLPESLIVRVAAREDADGLATLIHERQGGDLNQHRERLCQQLSDDSASIRTLVLVAETDGRFVGYGKVRCFQPTPDSPPNVAPPGWYLAGLIVTPAVRHRGIGAELTRRRLAWITERADEAYYFANANNAVTIALHARFGFAEVTRDFVYPGMTFSGGVGILFRADLTNWRWIERR